jgi:hypothetical protein
LLTARTCLYFLVVRQTNGGLPQLIYSHIAIRNTPFSSFALQSSRYPQLSTQTIAINTTQTCQPVAALRSMPTTSSTSTGKMLASTFGTRSLLIISRLRGVPVPSKIKCGRCHKNFPPTKYSTKQLTDLRYQLHHHGRQSTAINCVNCTGQQIVEIECTMCHKTKGLDEYAKSQRSKPDTAVSVTILVDLY